MNNWQDYLQTHRERFISELLDFLRIPSISALPEHAQDIVTAAQWTAKRLSRAGLENVQVLPTQGHPAVYADWLHCPGKPTLLFYGHMDVQPVDPLELWESPPFEPVLKDDAVYARGATDDKGNLLSPIAAVEALLATEKTLPVNVKVLIEGEEETGSPHLRSLLVQHKQMLACDIVISADGLQWSVSQPQLVVSYRGITVFQIDVSGPNVDQHSGLYGGTIANPNHALAQLIASFHDPEGTIAVEGFYDAVRPVTPQDRERFAMQPFDEQELLTRLNIPALSGEAGYTPLERIGLRPTLEVSGLYGGFQGEGSKNIIPARATAKLSCRLVADQDSQQILDAVRAHINRHTPQGVTVTLTPLPGTAIPYTMPADHPANQITAGILEKLYGVAPFFTSEGGSIPACTLFLQELDAWTVSFSFAHEDENLHAPNEFFRLSSMDKGQTGYVLLMKALEQMKK